MAHKPEFFSPDDYSLVEHMPEVVQFYFPTVPDGYYRQSKYVQGTIWVCQARHDHGARAWDIVQRRWMAESGRNEEFFHPFEPPPPPPRVPDWAGGVGDAFEIRMAREYGTGREWEFNMTAAGEPRLRTRADAVLGRYSGTPFGRPAFGLYVTNEGDLMQEGLRHFDCWYGLRKSGVVTLPPERLVSHAQRLWAWGLSPFLWLLPDDAPVLHAYDDETIMRIWSEQIPAIDPFIVAVVLGLEEDEYRSASRANRLARHLRSLTRRPICRHFRSQTVSRAVFDTNRYQGVSNQIIFSQHERTLTDDQFVREVREVRDFAQRQGLRHCVAETTQGAANETLGRNRGRRAMQQSGVIGTLNGWRA